MTPARKRSVSNCSSTVTPSNTLSALTLLAKFQSSTSPSLKLTSGLSARTAKKRSASTTLRCSDTWTVSKTGTTRAWEKNWEKSALEKFTCSGASMKPQRSLSITGITLGLWESHKCRGQTLMLNSKLRKHTKTGWKLAQIKFQLKRTKKRRDWKT